jgi:surface antigen
MRTLCMVLVLLAVGCGEPPTTVPTMRAWSGSLRGIDSFAALAVRMEESDLRRASGVLEHAATGETFTWVNAETGSTWEMTPSASSRSADGAPCRRFEISARSGLEHLEEIRGIACREPTGDWQVIG